jgi:glycosyltransferase involved in cell wall biosynthesis
LLRGSFVGFQQWNAPFTRITGIDPQRIEMIHWAVGPPEISAASRVIPSDYICAVGSQGRDYGVLVEAMKSLPGIRLVIVATKEAMRGVESIPSNVEARSSIPLREATNIIANSKFMVLPLLGQHVPCGHVTIVAAMHLSKAIIATASSGIADYVHDGVNGRLAAASDHAKLAALIAELVESPDDCRRLGEAGQRFAQQHCSEDNAVDFFLRVLPILIAGRHYSAPAETLSPSTGFGV